MLRGASTIMALAAMSALDDWPRVKRYEVPRRDEPLEVLDFDPSLYGQRLGAPRPEPVRYETPPLPAELQQRKIERAKAKRARKGW